MSLSLQPNSSSSESKAKEDAENDVELKEEEPTPEGKQHPLLALAQQLFLVSSADAGLDAGERQALVREVQEQIETDEMAGLYTYLEARRTDPTTEVAYKYLTENGWKPDAVKLAAWQAKNASEVAAADAKIKEASEIAGDTEVREAMFARANLHMKWGDKEKALEEYNQVTEKTVGIASKLDVLMAKLRLSLAFLDTKNSQLDPNLKQFKTDLDKAKVLMDQGGDWERKNQLAVYEAVYLMVTRQFSEASKLLLDAIATFTTTELFDYTTFVLHACALSLIYVDRASLQKDILKSPEILSVVDEIPGLRQLLTSLYKCNYRDFFSALNTLMPELHRSRYLAPHLKYYLRELRVVAYTQFLASYKSAKLEAMADAFGVSVDFMDQELFKFISAGRIHAKIDKVASRVDTNRPDKRNQIYGQLVKNGDVLLNRLHKLSKVVAL